MSCLADETLAAMVDGRLSDEEAASVDEHIDTCPICRALVTEVARNAPVSGMQHKGASSRGQTTTPESTAPPKLLPGQVLGGRFEVLRPVGRGGMGVVYEAADRQLDVELAIKVLPPEATSNPQLLNRLRKEIVLGRRVTHPNICRLYDLTEEDGVHLISMEYLEGQPLHLKMAGGRLALDERLDVLEQILMALHAAHAHQVIHRDLKPANIMVGPDNKVSVMDFGLAGDLHGEGSDSGVLLGTPAYWSPEQSTGERATPRSDIYSFGVVACELLSGKRPSLDAEPDLSGVPDSYRSLVRRCVQLAPGSRPAAVSEVLAELRRIRRRRPRGVVWAAFGAGAAALVALAWIVVGPGGDPPVPTPTPDTAAAEAATGGAPAADPPASTASETPVVAVRATPPNAAIYRDQTLLGRGAVEVPFETADESVTLRVERRGFLSKEIRVRPADGPTVDVTLTRARAGGEAPMMRASEEQVGDEPEAEPLPFFD